MLINKQLSLIKIIITLGFLILFAISCGPVTQLPFDTPTPNLTASNTPSPSQTPTATPYTQLVKLAEMGKGTLPEIARSPDGKSVIVNDGYTLRQLDSSDYSEISTMKVSDDGYAGGISFSPYGQFITISSGFSGFDVIDLGSQRTVAHGYGGNGSAYGPVFTPDNQSVLYLAADRTTGGPYHGICKLNLTKKQESPDGDMYGDCYPVLYENRYHVLTVPVISPDGTLVAAGYSDSTNNILYIWDLKEHVIKFEIKEQPSKITSVGFSSDGSLLASSSLDGMVRLWNPATGKLKRTITGFLDDVQNVKFSSDNRELIIRIANQPEFTFDLASGKTVFTPGATLDPLAEQMLGEGYLLAGGGSKVVFSPDGKNIAVGHGSIQIWDLQNHELALTLFDKEGSMSLAGMTYSPDGNHLGIVTTDGGISSWDLRSGVEELSISADALLSGQAMAFYAAGGNGLGPGIGTGVYGEQGIAYSPNGKEVAFGNDVSIDVWDIESASKIMSLGQIQPLAFPTSVSYSQDGKFIYGVLNRNSGAAIWDAVTGKLIHKLDLPAVDPNAFSAIALNGHLFARNNYDESDYWIEIWNLDKGKMVKLPTHVREVEPMRFSADGKFLIALVDHRQLYIWRTDTGQLVFVSDETYDIGDIALSPDDDMLATADYGKIGLWDIGKYSKAAFQSGFVPPSLPLTPTPWSSDGNYPTSTPQPTQIVPPFPVPPSQPDAITPAKTSRIQQIARIGKGSVDQLSWSTVDNTITVCSSQGVYQYDPKTLLEVNHFESESIWVSNSQVTKDGRVLFAGVNNSGKVEAWDATASTKLADLPGNGQPAISPDGKWLAFAGGISGLSTLNLETGQGGMLLRSDSQYSYWPVFSPDSRLVAAIQSDNSIRVWDLQTGAIVTGLGGPEVEITDMSFSPDGNYIVGAAGGTAWIWSLAPSLSPYKIDLYKGHINGNLTLYDNTVTAVAINEDNSLIAVGTSEHDVWLYNRKLGRLLGKLIGHSGTIAEMSFAPDGTQLVSISHDGQMIVWNLANQEPIVKSHPHNGPISGLITRLDGNISAWAENTIWTFNTEGAGLNQTTYVTSGKILAVSPAGDLVAAYSPYRVSLYDISTGNLLKTLSEEAEDPWVEYYWEGQISQQFYGAVFSSDGKRLATLGTGGVWMYDILGKGLISHLEGNNSRKAAISSDGEWLVVSRHEQAWPPSLIKFDNAEDIFDFEGGVGRDYPQYAISLDKRWIGLIRNSWSEPSLLQIVDTTTGQVVKDLPFEGQTLTSLVFNLGADIVAVGTENGAITLIDINTMEIVKTMNGHKGRINYLIFSPDNRYLLSAGEDGVIKVWGFP